MCHPQHCLANHPGFSSNITSATHFSMPPMPLMLAHHSPQSQWHATHANHASTETIAPTLHYDTNARTPSTPPTLPTLACCPHLHTTHASFPATQASHHSSTSSMKGCHPCHLTLRFLIHEKFREIEQLFIKILLLCHLV